MSIQIKSNNIIARGGRKGRNTDTANNDQTKRCKNKGEPKLGTETEHKARRKRRKCTRKEKRGRKRG